MHKIKVSQRYEGLYRLEVLDIKPFQSPTLSGIFSNFPILFRTDAAARSIGNLIISDLVSPKHADQALVIDKQSVLLGKKDTLLEIVKIWHKQNLFLDCEIKISNKNVGEALEIDESLMMKIYNLSS